MTTRKNSISPQAQTARDSARRADGTFGHQVKNEADGSLLDDGAVRSPSLQTDAPLQRVTLQQSSRSTYELARQISQGQIDLTPPYQRGTVWTDEQRVALVKSLQQGVPIPAIILNDRFESGMSGVDDPMYAAVDGKQRLETLHAWYFGDLAVPASWFPDEEVDTTVDTDDGPYVTFSGLTQVGQRRNNKAPIPVVSASLPTMADEADLYLLVNGGGVAQTDADMDNARRHSNHP